MARIAIVEDMAMVRDLLAQSIASGSEHEVVATYAEGRAALAGIRQVKPDLVLLDVVLPGLGGLDIARQLRSDARSPRVILLTAHEQPEAVLSAVRLGVHGIVLKGAALSTLLEAIDRVLGGGTFYCQGTAHLLRDAHTAPSAPSDLSPREKEILQLVAGGLSSKEVAERLALSPKTVRNHRQNLMRKLGVHNAASLTRWAIDHGLSAREPRRV